MIGPVSFALAALLLGACTADDEPVDEATATASSVTPVVAASSLDAAKSCEQLVLTYLDGEGDRIAAIGSAAETGMDIDTAAFAPGDAEADADAVAARLGCTGPDIAAMLCQQSVRLAQEAGEERVPAVCR